jgi:hypothetical protein
MEKHLILGAKVNPYQRPGSPLWQCAALFKGKTIGHQRKQIVCATQKTSPGIGIRGLLEKFGMVI